MWGEKVVGHCSKFPYRWELLCYLLMEVESALLRGQRSGLGSGSVRVEHRSIRKCNRKLSQL